MAIENNRLLLEIEQAIRKINQSTIKPVFPALAVDGLAPVISMVARTRADYLKELFDLAEDCADHVPTGDQVERLRSLRLSFEEVVAAAQALETAIQRGYLEVVSPERIA